MDDDLLRSLGEVRTDLVAVIAAMQSDEHPSVEECGIAFVTAEHALEVVNRLELDLITAEVSA